MQFPTINSTRLKRAVLWVLVLLLVAGSLAALAWFNELKYFADLLLRYLTALVWPIVITYFLWYFRSNIGGLINRIKHIGIGNASISTEDIEQAKDLQENANTTLAENRALTNVIMGYQQQLNELSQYATQNQQQLQEQLSYKDIELDFERIYNALFRSQLILLQSLRNSTVAARSFLELYFNTVRANNPTEFADWTLDNYLMFLFSRGILEYLPSGEYKLTYKGEVFMNYIENIGYGFNTKVL